MLNICVFATTSENGALVLYFYISSNNSENIKKLQSIVVFIKISSQSKEAHLVLNNPFF